MAGVGPRQDEKASKYLDPSHARRLAEAITRLPHTEGNSSSSKTTNNVSNNNTVNVGSVSVAGRTSARGMADDLRRNAKARDMRTGMA